MSHLHMLIIDSTCRTGDVAYEAPLPLRAATVLIFIAAGTATAWLIHAGQYAFLSAHTGW